MSEEERMGFLAESEEVTAKYALAINAHIGWMASINADLRAENARLRGALWFCECQAALIVPGDCLDAPGIASLIEEKARIARGAGQ